ncbi:4-hydroxy-tetrahydrodipicolinate synthase [Aliiruegeria haliotis]|uniref:4-hydroxy-tetrahydrodipicolinate synthase n=1 Tax=Aliiruegeria haliotis TaxID=1280846 RepID=A0A2T0RMA2_9RHOB|nr:dihydrodipicolinate synthase family protein [Aliiruegeria haliotis]PRY22260.1 4-hydroxy-tetrahydrodipicolinate synthase [Aliiruegeria haliotis]
MSKDYKGIWPVMYAFWGEDGRLDREAMKRQIDYCIAMGVHGITVHGLVTEVHKMDVNERMHLVEMVGDLIGGRTQYAVTVAEPTIKGQVAFSHAAARAGADFVILQPPAIKGITQDNLIDFFGSVADAVDVDVAIQNNPVNLDVSLSVGSMIELNRRHPNIGILKGEGFSIDIETVIRGSGGAFKVFGGHGGIEFPALLRSGGVGLIPAPDYIAGDMQIWRLWEQGGAANLPLIDRIHAEMLPAIVFMSRSVPAMLCYGKRLFARQAGIEEVHDRAPFVTPTEFGLEELVRFEAMLARAGAPESLAA